MGFKLDGFIIKGRVESIDNEIVFINGSVDDLLLTDAGRFNF